MHLVQPFHWKRRPTLPIPVAETASSNVEPYGRISVESSIMRSIKSRYRNNAE
jgi:hypothetical protein